MPRNVRRPARTLSTVAVAASLLVGCHGRGPGAPSPGMPTAVAALAPFDPAAVGPGAPPRPGPAAALEVVDYGPQGRSDGDGEIHLRFNQPVVELGLLDPAGVTAGFTIDPPLPGHAEWRSPELLVFKAVRAPRPGHRYTVRFTGAVVGLDGQRFEQPLTWTFETPRPMVRSSAPRSEALHERAGADLYDGVEAQRRDLIVLVAFDRPVALEQAQAHLRAVARPFVDRKAGARSAGVPVAVRVRTPTKAELEEHSFYDDADDERVFAVQPRGLWPDASEIEVSVSAGLLAEEGPLPLDTPWSMVFRTHGPQAIVAMNCDPADPCGLEPIELRLRNPVEAREARKIEVSPRPKDLKIQGLYDYGEGSRDLLIEGQFVPGTTYKVQVPDGLQDAYGARIAGGAARLALIAPRATLALSASSGILRPGPAQTIGVEARHVRSIRVRVGVFTDAEMHGLVREDGAFRRNFPARVIERDLPLTPTGQADWSSLALDLADLSGGARQAVLVEVAATDLTARARPYGLPGAVRGMFRLTDLGPILTVSLPASSVQVLRLSSGAPVPGARVARFDRKQGGLLELGVTDASGLLALPAELLPPPPGRFREDPDSAIPLQLTVIDPAHDDHAHIELPFRRDTGDRDDKSGPSPLRPGERLIARVVPERGVYRPGEKVRVVGWSAVDTPFSRSNLGRLKAGTRVVFELVDPLTKVVATHATRTSAEGKFWAELPVPAGAALGSYSVTARLAGDATTASVKVEDYRVPEFSVDARARRPDILVGEQTVIDVHASYYFGGPVPMSRVARSTQCRPQRFRPPGLEDIWDTGEAPPGGGSYQRHGGFDGRGQRVFEPEPAVPTPGHGELRDGGDPSETRHPQGCTVSVAVLDASLQEVGAELGFTVHPAAFYLAVAAPRGALEAGARVAVPLRAVSIAGERVAAARVELLVTRRWQERTYKRAGGQRVFDGWVDRSEKITTCRQDLPSTGADPVCALPPLKAGGYELAASAGEPGSARIARTVTRFYVDPKDRAPADDDWLAAPIERLEVLVDRKNVKPGDTLEVAVRGPWPGARGNLVLARGGIRETHPLVLENNAARFKFKVDDTWTPAVDLHATVVQPASADPRERPQIKRATATVRQGFEHRRLKVAVEAPAQVGPGARAELRVKVRDEMDRPIAARVALWAVDEAVLALTRHEAPDLLPTFVSRRPSEIHAVDDYEDLIFPYIVRRADPWYSGARRGLIGKGGGGGSGSSRQGAGGVQGGGPPPARGRFETTPVFLADLAVDSSGEARVAATLPDNLSTFRITAIASARLVDGSGPGRFGKNDARTVVTAPLVLRAALPRQLRPGDRAELAAIVQNNTGAAGKLTVTADLVEKPGTHKPALEITSSRRATAKVEDGGQARVVFEVRALAPGAPELELRASLTPRSGGPAIHDGLRLPLPVAAERTLTERVATHGTLADDRAIALPIKIPRDVLPGHGGVTVAATSTLLGGLEDAVHALVEYPHGCIEQTASRLLPIVAVHRLVKDYPLGVADPAEFMRVGVEHMLSMQTASGGFSYWPGGQDVHVYASAYATWVLQRAHAAGYPVPKLALERALDDLAGRVRKLDVPRVDQGDGVRLAIAVHALADAGREVRDPAVQLHAIRQRLPLFARAFLLMAIHRDDPKAPEVATLLAELLANIRELPATAHTSEQLTRDLDDVFTSDGRSDAIVLMALLRVKPDHPIVAKLARGLLERRAGGRWRNTQENAYALVALLDYARIYEAEAPDFNARAWVGGARVLDVQFRGRELAPRASFTDMAAVLRLSQKPDMSQGTGDTLLPVVLQRQGTGRLYYRLGAEWAPAQTDLPARAQGFTVTRGLRTREGAVTTSVNAGEPIAMDITLRTDVRVRYVAVDVPLPAGLEGVSRTLGEGRGASVLSGGRGWWVSREEQRPDRVVLFADDLPPGTHKHTIDLRSTSRGRFSFPPALAEAMYMPEVHGRTVGAALEVR
jgi:uncharacterized protein YfaS (alpha-2-macroglobulin family)